MPDVPGDPGGLVVYPSGGDDAPVFQAAIDQAEPLIYAPPMQATSPGFVFTLGPGAEQAAAQVAAFGEALGRGLSITVKHFLPVAEGLGRSILEAFGVMSSAELNRLLHRLTMDRRHRRRCRVCNPYGNPPPERGHYKPGPKAARIRGRRRSNHP